MKLSAALSVMPAVVVLALAAAPTAHAVAPATAAPAEAKQAAEAKQQEPSAAERRAADSEFEREKLDQGAFAEADAEAKADEGGSGKASEGGSILRMIFGLVVVLGAIYGVHYLLKRWGNSRIQGVAGRTGVIDVVATTPLAQGRALHLVRVGEDLVLVGATEQSITRIVDVDSSALGAGAANQGNGEFQAMLSGAMYGSQPGVPTGMGGAGSTSEPFLKRFVDNLRMSTAR